jgi:hypothetical protein
MRFAMILNLTLLILNSTKLPHSANMRSCLVLARQQRVMLSLKRQGKQQINNHRLVLFLHESVEQDNGLLGPGTLPIEGILQT